MVETTPPQRNKMFAALNPVLIEETLKKVDRCLVRLQELQFTVAGGTKVVSGVSLSPGGTRGYLRTSLRCKQESIRIKNEAPKRSPQGKFPRLVNSEGEWRQMSLPAMIVGETVGEILQASQFAREIVSAVGKTTNKEPKTPPPQWSNQKVDPENTQLKARRNKEKQIKLRYDSPPPQRARSRINFKVRESDKENNKYLANGVYASNRPCGSNKTVLFANPLFLSTSSSRQQQFSKTRSPVILRNEGTQHKVLIKSPPSASKFQVKVKSPPNVYTSSPTRPTCLSKKKCSPKRWVRPFSPSRKSDGPKKSAPSKLCRSFSPSRLATKLVSPLKSKKSKGMG
ncbi:microtubule-binding protein TANGLED [Abrus precatorius]|uniref:Microtubule-binding protein TANGLED n=1 Tax=Abrus precatorius TaxID=3816 RepID=A0A8B8L1Y1_ABRPR|nr:microtubule-binding protein TANGLED [Abrus precatorius]